MKTECFWNCIPVVKRKLHCCFVYFLVKIMVYSYLGLESKKYCTKNESNESKIKSSIGKTFSVENSGDRDLITQANIQISRTRISWARCAPSF